MSRININEFNRKVREAQRKAEQQVRRQVDQVNRENKRRVDEYNRRAEAHNRQQVAALNALKARLSEANRQAEAQTRQAITRINASAAEQNRRADARNRKSIEELKRQFRSASSPVRYTESERLLADRVQGAVAAIDPREYDSFLSYARIDGAEVAEQLRASLEALDVAVWFDAVAIVPGRSQSLQMDAGLRKARSGIALLTPAYLTGRFWTERELGALLNKSTLIPVLHKVTFEDVKQYSGILPDLAGFSTALDDIQTIAEKIAASVLTA